MSRGLWGQRLSWTETIIQAVKYRNIATVRLIKLAVIIVVMYWVIITVINESGILLALPESFSSD